MTSRFNVSLKRQPLSPLDVEICNCRFDASAATFWERENLCFPKKCRTEQADCVEGEKCAWVLRVRWPSISELYCIHCKWMAVTLSGLSGYASRYAMETKNGTIFRFGFMSLSLVANVWSMKFYLCWHFGRFLGQLSRFVWIASEVTASWDLETSQVYVGREAWVWIRVRVGLRVDGSASDFKSSTVRVKLWPGYFFSHFPLRDNKRVASPYMCDFKVGAKLNAK